MKATAIKDWFLEKNELQGMKGKTLTTRKETAKAVLVEYSINGRIYTQWVPKSVIIDEWEKDTSNFGYHAYLVEVLNTAFQNGTLENTTFRSGRNTYDCTSFTHQKRTNELIRDLTAKNIDFMSRQEWNNR